MRATLTSKSQLTLPAAIRRELGLGPGDQLDFTLQPEGWLKVEPIHAVKKTGSIMDLKGMFAGRGPKMTLDEMEEMMLDAVSDHVMGLDEADAHEDDADGAAV